MNELRQSKGLLELFRGHLLLFDRRAAPAYSATTGARLLLAALLLELVRLAAVKWAYPAVPLLLLLALMLGLSLLAVPWIAGLRVSQLGLPQWRDWTLAERSYFLQVLVIANVVFPMVFATQLRAHASQLGTPLFLWSVFVPYLCFGFYQEVVYRGMVQLELVRRWGAPLGILVANVLYTFGPLHWAYFSSPASLAVPMFGAIFAMGIFFGIMYWRSGNLWMSAIFHAIGNAYVVSSLGPAGS